MKSLAAILALLAFAGCSTDSRTPAPIPPPIPAPFSDSTPFPQFSIADSETAGFRPAKANIRAVHGEVQYANGGGWEALSVNLQLTNGAKTRTGPGAEVFLQVTGLTATIKLLEDTQLELMEMMGQDAAITRTALEVRKGTILGSVRKLPPESSFQVHGGEVTLKVHGTDFQMSARGRVEIVTGAGTVTSRGKGYHLAANQYFDPEKNEVGNLPPSLLSQIIGPGMPPEPRPSQPAFSPFDRGLENARHGWVAPAAGN